MYMSACFSIQRSKPLLRYSTLRNETKRNEMVLCEGTLRNGTLRNGTLRNDKRNSFTKFFSYALPVYGASDSDRILLDRCMKKKFNSKNLNIRDLLEKADKTL